jgi:hypothetical protein
MRGPASSPDVPALPPALASTVAPAPPPASVLPVVVLEAPADPLGPLPAALPVVVLVAPPPPPLPPAFPTGSNAPEHATRTIEAEPRRAHVVGRDVLLRMLSFACACVWQSPDKVVFM